LNIEQQEAFENIQEFHEKKEVVLLHGVTGSGKTEVYIQLIDEVIKQGKQVLYLLPEIALTTQAIVRLQKVFGDKVGIYHSRQNENERVEIWNRVLNCDKPNTYPLVLGARSALFLPFSNLGLVIVDEEHDFSYKQNEPAPRYHARDAAIYLALQHKAKVVLGTATPSIESYYNTTIDKYGLATIKNRFGNAQLPTTQIVDMKPYRKEKTLHSYFSNELIDSISETLKAKKQVILFQNRRGFAPILECRSCAHIPQCINCDVSLTYHKNINTLRCHYCGYSTPPPQVCVKCGATEILMKGAGTEKIEEELQLFFQEARIARMDLDTTRSKYAFQQLIYEFEEGNIDILVGTQMVSKGLDFENVGLVGVINADALLHYPNFRSFERCYQLLVQVSGRAGRSEDIGKVIIQTASPENFVIQHVINNNYYLFFQSQLLERQNFNYPPFCKLIELNLRCKDIDELNAGANYLSESLKVHFGKRLLGPEFPAVARIRNVYHKNILLKIETNASIINSKKIITQHIQEFTLNKDFKKVQVAIDVDVYE
jgi:primosomal protein N' (replication factor Y)